MSQENVENLRAVLEAWDIQAWKRGGFDVSLLDPEVTYEDTILPDHVGETYRGHEGVARAVARWFEPYVWVEATHLAVYTLTDGKVIQMQVFDDRQQAMKAVGLAE